MSEREPKKLQVLGKFGKGGVEIPGGAAVGQMIVVKSVDENGKPTEWEAVDRTHYDARETLLEFEAERNESLACYELADTDTANAYRELLEQHHGGTLTVEAGGVNMECPVCGQPPEYRLDNPDTGERVLLCNIGGAYGHSVRLYPSALGMDNFEPTCAVKIVSGEIVQLDEKFIPDTIARKTDIPGEREALAMLIETDMLPAVHDGTGAILTDQNGNIILRY